SSMPVYYYYSKDGTSYQKVGSGNLKDGEPAFLVSKGNPLGYLLITDMEIASTNADNDVPADNGSKDNASTGGTDAVSVAVALAVVSLVAIGAVCVKKVSE
ncbi:MAG: hypothetical protein IJF27_01955, partial [Oscillospiraceae bacterium]|nr:hypothetical protein [Oscillospiraceae bacterium]